MALFRRNKTDDLTGMPEEVNTYYQAENRERTWMAWLLALVTLTVTAIIIIGLFFGGRWVYRKIRHQSSSTSSVVTQKPAEPATSNGNTPNPTPASTQTQNPSSDTTTPSTGSGNVNAPANPNPSGNSNATPPATTPATTPATNTNLPNTGPGDMLSIFVVVSVVGYLIHRRSLSQK